MAIKICIGKNGSAECDIVFAAPATPINSPHRAKPLGLHFVMEIHSDYEEVEPLFDAIRSAPFSDSFQQLFINEILTSPGLRFGNASVKGVFACSQMTTTEAGNLLVRVRLSREGEVMVSALRALSGAPFNKD